MSGLHSCRDRKKYFVQEVIRSRFYHATAEWLEAFTRNEPEILPDEEILMALRNSSGARPTLFVPEQVRHELEVITWCIQTCCNLV
jgi:hypothetical protein